MRYTTAFTLTKEFNESSELNDKYLLHLKKTRASELGVMISEKIGFDKAGPNYWQEEKYRMEIDVFAHKDWMDFKMKLKGLLVDMDISPSVGSLILELEKK